MPNAVEIRNLLYLELRLFIQIVTVLNSQVRNCCCFKTNFSINATAKIDSKNYFNYRSIIAIILTEAKPFFRLAHSDEGRKEGREKDLKN